MNEELLHRAATTIDRLTEAQYSDEDIPLDEFEEYRELSDELLEAFHEESYSHEDPAFSESPNVGARVRCDESSHWMHPMVVTEKTNLTASERIVDEVDGNVTVEEYWSEKKGIPVDPDDPVVVCRTPAGKELDFPVSRLHNLSHEDRQAQ